MKYDMRKPQFVSIEPGEVRVRSIEQVLGDKHCVVFSIDNRTKRFRISALQGGNATWDGAETLEIQLRAVEESVGRNEEAPTVVVFSIPNNWEVIFNDYAKWCVYVVFWKHPTKEWQRVWHEEEEEEDAKGSVAQR